MLELNTNLKETAYTYIKDKILNCEYYPGQDISEKQIVEMIRTGRTPVREALIMLQRENLVEIYPRKGTCAKTITIPDTIELYQLRKLLEPAAAKNFKQHISPEKLLEFDAEFLKLCNDTDPNNEKKFYRLDVAFHQFIIDSTGNTRLIEIYQKLLQDTYRIGIFSMLQHNNNSKNSTYSAHHRIIQALLTEDDNEIEAAFTLHINQSLISALKTLKNVRDTP